MRKAPSSTLRLPRRFARGIAHRVASLGFCLLTWVLAGVLPSARLEAQQVLGFRRGDCNATDTVDIADAVFQLQHLFQGVAASCESACDSNDDGRLDISDPISVLVLLFANGPPLPAPGLGCGVDLTPDTLSCHNPPCVAAQILEERTYTLATARIGQDYTAGLPAVLQERVLVNTGGPPQVVQPPVPYDSYGVLSGTSLTPGLALDPRTGVITGQPLAPGVSTLSLWARAAGGLTAVLYHAELAAFSENETEIVAGQDLSGPGPYTVWIEEIPYLHHHDLPWPQPYPLWQCLPIPPPAGGVPIVKDLRLYRPVGAPQPMPLVIFHHGASSGYDDYDQILVHLASQGALCVSVDDPFSYAVFPTYYCWGGHEEGARVMISARNHLLQLAQDNTSTLFGVPDPLRVFYAGHSRGGASAIVAREFDPAARGVIALQPTDAKGDSFIGNTDRWVSFPSTPLLLVGVEQDNDVIYPWGDRLLERAIAHTAMVTIYGGCHGYTTDAGSSGCAPCQWSENPPFLDTCRYIARDLQHTATREYLAAFLRRHAFQDLSVEGLLYGSERQGSPILALTARRHLGGAIWIDDFDAAPLNSLGLPTMSTPGHFTVGNCYDLPAPPPAPIGAIENLVIEPPLAPSAAVHTSTLGTLAAPLAADQQRALVFRLKNHDVLMAVDNFGFDWLAATVTLTDGDGESASVDLVDHLPANPFHPASHPPGTLVRMKYQRFLTVTVALDEFTAANPDLDLTQLVTLAWSFSAVSAPLVPPRLALDDVRLE